MKDDTYGEPTIIQSQKAIVRVYHPILTEQEHKKRRQAIYKATAELLKEYERVKANEKV